MRRVRVGLLRLQESTENHKYHDDEETEGKKRVL